MFVVNGSSEVVERLSFVQLNLVPRTPLIPRGLGRGPGLSVPRTYFVPRATAQKASISAWGIQQIRECVSSVCRGPAS